jgi:hypothetical protein
MKTKLRGVFVVDPAFDVPVEVFPYRQPRDAGWTRQTFKQAVAAHTPALNRNRHAPSIWTPRPVSTGTNTGAPARTRDRNSDRVDAHARWRDVISTGQ